VGIIKPSCLLAGAVVLFVAPLATMALAGTSSAASPDLGVACTKLRGHTDTDSANLSGCTNAPSGGTGAILNFTPTGGDVHWANDTTTQYTANYTNPSSGCPAGAMAYKIAGSVTSSTNDSTPVGQTVKMKVCLLSTGVIKNETGTVVKF
jgi:hypothetical protein